MLVGRSGPSQKHGGDGRAGENARRDGTGGEQGASRGEAGVQEGVGVPSYLVIYSPRAPGYPSRGITQGWACRAPGVSFRAGRLAISLGESRIAFDFPYLLAQTAPGGHRSGSMNREGNRRYFFAWNKCRYVAARSFTNIPLGVFLFALYALRMC